MAVARGPAVLRFGNFELDALQRRLRRDGKIVPLTPKQFATLELLVLHAGETLSKETMLSTVWPQAFVEEGNLAQNIFWLRKVLGQSQNDLYIITEPGVGYRFVAAVAVVEAEPEPEAQPVSVEQATPSSATPGVPERMTPVVPGPIAAEPHSAEPPEPRPLLPPDRRTRPRWLWPGAAAGLVLLAVLGAGYLWRERHDAAHPPVKHRVVLAEFSNLTSDPNLGHTLQSALRMSLEQSKFFTVLSESDTAETLREMRRAPDDPLTSLEVASEVCERNGQSSVLHGSVVRLGSRYQLGLEARECKSQRVIAAAKTMTDTQDGLLNSLDGLVEKVRSQAGEPAWNGTIDSNGRYSPPSQPLAETDAPMEQVTTHSMEALKAFVQGDYFRARDDTFEAVALYERAIEVDPGFAMAYARLGAIYQVLNEDKKARQYFQRAYDLSVGGGLFPRERLYILTHYTTSVTGDLNATIATYLAWTNSFPDDAHPWINLSWDCYDELGEYDKAIEAGRNAVAKAPYQGNAYIALALAALHGGKVAEAHAACDRDMAARLDGWEIHDILFRLAVLREDRAAAAEQLRWAHARPIEYQARYDEAWLALRDGRVNQSRALFREARGLALGQHAKEAAAGQSALQAIAMFDYGYPAEAKALLAEAADDAPSGLTAFAAAVTGDAARAKKLSAALASGSPQDTLVQTFDLPRTAAELQFLSHDYLNAADTLGGVGAVRMRDYSIPMLAGESRLLSGDPAAAQAQFASVLENPGVDPLSPALELAQLGLARSLASAHQTEAAKAAYRKLLAGWHDADPDLPVLRTAGREAAGLQ